MTDTTTEWTPERRKIREVERGAARSALTSMQLRFDGEALAALEAQVDRLYPPPPPEYTYGREVYDYASQMWYRRRSDGSWECSRDRENWMSSFRSDTEVRALAAEVLLSDAECDALTLGSWSGHRARRAFIRAAIARVLRGEVNGNG